jgi:predicted unusual protein kinase regulating ubiquinone biosynthesis (AarF/ABC1/UbiB family)
VSVNTLLAWVLWIGLGLAGVATLAYLWSRLRDRNGISRGRFGRMARLGGLSARLATSRVGATVRRLFAGRERRARIDQARREAAAAAVTRTMGEMKGVVMKLGQMMSFVSDAVPAEYRAALRALQADAPPMELALLREVAERELGKPLERAFARFDEQPLASASIGQVHRARLPSGEEVVVKIQYPGVAEAIRNDLGNAAFLYRMMALFYPGLEPGPVIEELRARISEELDYGNEARSQAAFHALYQGHPFIRVPRVYPSHSTTRVLTSEYIAGRRFDDILAADEATRNRVGEILYRFVFGSIITYGAFNADPHPGNYLYDDDGRVVFLDYGCVKYFPAAMLATWIELVKAQIDRDLPRFRALTIDAGFIKADSKVPTELLYDYFSYYYDPFREDREYRFTAEYNARSMEMMFKPTGEFAGLTRRLNLPRDYAPVNRLTFGVVSILSQLDAVGNWHRIHRELLHGDPPSTALGQLDAAFTRERIAGRGLGDAPLLLRPEGLVARVAELTEA